MKKPQIVLLLVFLFIPALTVAQTTHSANASANGHAQSINRQTKIISNEQQQLRRHDPQMQFTEQDFGQDKLSVGLEKGIPQSTGQALIKYITGQYRIAQLIIGIYKLPDADNLYFVLGTAYKDQQAQEQSEVQTLFLVLREQGDVVSEVSKIDSESDAANKEPVFFHGQNKLLIIVSESAGDGSFGGNYAFEYANNLKAAWSDLCIRGQRPARARRLAGA
jgi:hypothetical protein